MAKTAPLLLQRETSPPSSTLGSSFCRAVLAVAALLDWCGRPPPAGSPCQGCSSSREVLTSAAGGDMDAVKAFVSTWGGAALQEERSGLGLLHYSARRPGQHATVQWLLDRGAPVNQEDSRRRTPLWHAVVSGDADSVLVLGRAGANVNHPCLEGKTPLLALATQHGTAQAAQGGLGASVLATCQALLSFNAVDLRATFQGKMAEEWAPGIRDCIAEMVSLLAVSLPH